MATGNATFDDDIRLEGNKGDLNTLGQVAAKVKLGNMLSVIKVVVTGLTAAGFFDITTAAFKAALTSNAGITLLSGENLPAIGHLVSLRVTAATTASTAGTYGLTDVAGDMITANTHTVMGVARISDDGKTLSFPTADVTAFILQYVPRADVALTTVFNDT